MKKMHCLLLIGLAAQTAVAQEALLSRLLENEEDADEAALIELEEQPLNLRTVSRSELLRLPFLTPSQIDNFLAERGRRRDWQNADEALAVLAVAGDTLDYCRTIFHLPDPAGFPFFASSRIRLVRSATHDDHWQGSAYRNYQTLRVTYGALSAAALTERDPGEKQFDDLSLFFIKAAAPLGRTRMEFIAGDFSMEWGQGLALWGPYGQSVGASSLAPVRRQARGIRPYLSANEDFAFRGAALSMQRGPFDLTIFTSRATLDASMVDSATITLPETGGLHRTANELARRNLAEEKASSISLTTTGRNWRGGALFFEQAYDRLVAPVPHPTNYFDFSGNKNRLMSLYGEWNPANYLFAAEWAKNENGANAFQATFEAEARPLVLTGAFWDYDVTFHSSRGRGFGAYGDPPQNEQGKYLGLRISPARRWVVEGYLQIRNTPWRTFRLPLPNSSRDFGVIVEWHTQRSHVRARLRDRLRDELAPLQNSGGRNVLGTQRRQTLLFELRQNLGSSFRYFSRLDVHSYELRLPGGLENEGRKRQTGFALTQEIGWQPTPRFRIHGRWTIFDAPENQAIYVYERDLPGLITNFSLRENGERGYIYIVLQPASALQISAKAGRQWRLVDEENGNGGFTWGAQVDWHFGAAKQAP